VKIKNKKLILVGTIITFTVILFSIFNITKASETFPVYTNYNNGNTYKYIAGNRWQVNPDRSAEIISTDQLYAILKTERDEQMKHPDPNRIITTDPEIVKKMAADYEKKLGFEINNSKLLTTPDKTICIENGTPSDRNKSLPLIQCGNAGQPCCNVTELFTLINRIINWFLKIAGSIAAVTFTIAGVNILMHPDKPEEISKARSMFTKTIVGLIIVLLSWLVFHTVLSTLIDQSALRFLGS